MEDDEGAVDLLGEQTLQQVITHIDAKGIHTGRLQCLQNHGTGLQRYLALGALAAVEHGDAAEIARIDGGFECIAHYAFLSASVLPAAPNIGFWISCGARPPISPAPWQSRMSPARNSGLSSVARSPSRSR
ncbi:hypothetical protein D9M71_697430 [compost metagenome]